MWISGKAARIDESSQGDRFALPQSERKLTPVPAVNAQEQALKLVHDVLKDKYAAATTSERQKALSGELLQKAQETKDDAAAQYVTFKEAGRTP